MKKWVVVLRTFSWTEIFCRGISLRSCTELFVRLLWVRSSSRWTALLLCRLAISLYHHEILYLSSRPWQLARCHMTNVYQKHNFSTSRRMPGLYLKWGKPHTTSENAFFEILPIWLDFIVICCWDKNHRWESHSTMRNCNTWSRKFYRQIVNVGHSVAKNSQMFCHRWLHVKSVVTKWRIYCEIYNLYEHGIVLALLAVLHFDSEDGGSMFLRNVGILYWTRLLHIPEACF
jgi:hypothetical protein